MKTGLMLFQLIYKNMFLIFKLNFKLLQILLKEKFYFRIQNIMLQMVQPRMLMDIHEQMKQYKQVRKSK